MFQRVPADDMAGVENWLVSRFEDFRHGIDCERTQKVRSPGVTRRKQRHDQNQNNQRTELRERVRTQVSVTARLRERPILHARDSQNYEWREKNEANFHVDT